ncbi:prohead protease/major capsid protein fusion protein [Aurantimonas coralicida]|uniref:prohead protease/major capsid protein fusion protein n=1 Tax=Aurantimonas coralicida TaxID=182270 RepID=UPI001E390384|nr:prohead protease/major capsid protein fusion protein [Aurantimonas coralicida]MCD1642464.1 Mu-like prophage major head subunit gpT family protein [Aurantimonas coralicida]
MTRAAPLAASTWDAEAQTFTVVLSAGTAVPRQDARGAFSEVLDIAGATFPERIPLLDSHQRTSLDNKIGEVTDIRREGGELVGTARLSRHSAMAQRVAAELTDGARLGVSIGYAVNAWAETKSAGKRTKTATAFEVIEASLVSIPADPSATIRSNENMPTANTETTTTEAPTTVTRAAINAEVRSIARAAGLDQTFIDAQVDAEADLDAVRTAAFAAMTARGTAAATVRAPHNAETMDNPEVRARAAGEAMFYRANPAHKPSEQARQYVGMSTVDIARESLRHANVSTTGLGHATIVERALHTTSDFPMVFADTVNRQVRQAYESAPSGIRQIARQSTVRDFRAKTTVGLSNAITLQKVNEHGEFKSGTLIESAESYSADTYGAIIGITRKMIVNDDINAFTDISARLGRAAADFEADFLAAKLTANPKLADGKAVFHADHGNLAGTGAAITEASLSAARLAMRSQTDEGGNPIRVTPTYLVVGPAQETAAEKILAAISPANAADANPFAQRLTLVVDQRLMGNAWYVTASPGDVVSLEYSYLEGEPGPQITQEIGFDVDGLRFRVREDFGAGWLDYRGVYKNAGQ